MKKRPSVANSSPDTTPRRRRRLAESILVFAGCVLLIDGGFGEKGAVTIMKAREEYRQLERTLAAARAEGARLREEVRWLHEPAAIEDLARRELGLIKRGEKLFTIKDLTQAEAQH